MKNFIVAGFAGLTMLVAACGAAATPTAAPADGSWTTAYADTSCSDWSAKMTAPQRTVAASAMLSAIWKTDGSDKAPTEATVKYLSDGIDAVCPASPTDKITFAASTLAGMAVELKP